jgi:hypothetical protein
MKLNTEGLFQAAEELAQNVVVKRQKHLFPTWTLFDRDEHSTVIATPWEDELDKYFAQEQIKATIEKLDIVAYAFVSEVWVVVAPKGWTPDQGKVFPEPRNRPDRRELVWAIVNDGKTAVQRMWNIRRDSLERVIRLELQPTDSGDLRPGGWIANLL